MKIRGNTVGTTLRPDKVIVKATNLTEEEKAQARENIGAASADDLSKIDEALDRIIEMQNSLIGGDGT